MRLIIAYLLYAAIVLVAGRVMRKRKDPEKRGLLVFLTILSVVIPVAGLGFAMWFWKFGNAVEKKEDWFAEYEQHIHYKVENLSQLRAEALADLELIPVASGLTYKENGIHKRLISELGESRVKHRGRMLKQAVRHKDYETAHYAAAMLNTFQSRFEQRVRDLKSRLAQDAEPYLRLAETYAEHLESGFVTEDQEKQLIRTYKAFLAEAVGRFPEEPAFVRFEADQQLREGNVEQAYVLYRTVVTNHPGDARAYEGAIRSAYEMKDWSSLYQLVRLAGERNIPLSDTYRRFAEGVS